MKNETWSFLGEKIEAGQKAQVMIRPYGEDYEIPTTIINGKYRKDNCYKWRIT